MRIGRGPAGGATRACAPRRRLSTALPVRAPMSLRDTTAAQRPLAECSFFVNLTFELEELYL
jgi:hypothetical protein